MTTIILILIGGLAIMGYIGAKHQHKLSKRIENLDKYVAEKNNERIGAERVHKECINTNTRNLKGVMRLLEDHFDLFETTFLKTKKGTIPPIEASRVYEINKDCVISSNRGNHYEFKKHEKIFVVQSNHKVCSILIEGDIVEFNPTLICGFLTTKDQYQESIEECTDAFENDLEMLRKNKEIDELKNLVGQMVKTATKNHAAENKQVQSLRDETEKLEGIIGQINADNTVANDQIKTLREEIKQLKAKLKSKK